ncbi:MAG: hypothetical protein AMJ95_07150 [Omnitrophica WOR_2 bacterium SM23_72]|nr:MAG: hypothetical protein AMJ95_07150 [Omnitrophica WOR_2 bacterium SM23_72]
MIQKKKIKVLFVFLLCFSAIQQVIAQDINTKEKVKETKTMKEVQGEVTWVKQDKISIVYNTDESKGMDYEILLPVDKDTKLVHLKSIEQIKIGDRVRILYEEKTQESAGEVRSYRRAKVITFIGPALPKVTAPLLESDVLGSE